MCSTSWNRVTNKPATFPPAAHTHDHGSELTGKGDDDHPQYLLADGTRALSGNLDLGSNAIVSVGNVDGRDVSVDGAKLDTIEAGADVTDALNVAAAGATMDADADVSGTSWVLDEDDMASDSAAKVATQQSVKAYADGLLVPGKSWAQAYNSGAQNINVAGGVAINWDGGGTVTGSDLSHSTSTNPNRVTVNTTGRYLVSVSVAMTGAVQRSNVWIRLRKNGSTYRGPIGSSGYIRALGGHAYSSVHITPFLIQLTAADYIEIMSNQEAVAGTVNTIASACYINIFRVE